MLFVVIIVQVHLAALIVEFVLSARALLLVWEGTILVYILKVKVIYYPYSGWFPDSKNNIVVRLYGGTHNRQIYITLKCDAHAISNFIWNDTTKGIPHILT